MYVILSVEYILTPKNMILWTILDEKAWEHLQKNGNLVSSIKYIEEESWIPAYNWIADQMKKRLGPPPIKDCSPVWAWYQWGERKRPDLRAGHLLKNQRGVRIEFECHETSALLSDYDLWHFVLNYWYLSKSEADDEAFSAELEKHGLSLFRTRPLPHPEYHEKIVRSWDKIFATDWIEPHLTFSQEQKYIQATVWQLRIEQIRSYTWFKSR